MSRSLHQVAIGAAALVCTLGPFAGGEPNSPQDHHQMDPATHQAMLSLTEPLGTWEPTSGGALEEMPVL